MRTRLAPTLPSLAQASEPPGLTCRVYYLRFRLNVNDVFDQLEKFMKPLRPRVFNLITARDLRKAIAEIVEELGKL